MSAHSDEVKELAAKLLPGMRERAQIYFEEAMRGRTQPITPSIMMEVMMKTMADEFACAIIGMRP